jgi:hypothetical protein
MPKVHANHIVTITVAKATRDGEEKGKWEFGTQEILR